MFRFKQICSFALVGVACLGLSTHVFADQKVADESSISNIIISSEAKIAESAFFDIKDQIIHDYSQLYKLDDFSYDYTLRDEIGKKYLDINVYVDMTLTRHPSESPYVLGMERLYRKLLIQLLKKSYRLILMHTSMKLKHCISTYLTVQLLLMLLSWMTL